MLKGQSHEICHPFFLALNQPFLPLSERKKYFENLLRTHGGMGYTWFVSNIQDIGNKLFPMSWISDILCFWYPGYQKHNCFRYPFLCNALCDVLDIGNKCFPISRISETQDILDIGNKHCLLVSSRFLNRISKYFPPMLRDLWGPVSSNKKGWKI